LQRVRELLKREISTVIRREIPAAEAIPAGALLAPEVRFLRKSLGWSAEHLSAMMGVDPKTLSRWENGRQKVGPVAERFLRMLVLQKLEEDAKGFADQVLPTLGHEPAPKDEPLHMARSRNGWREAA
jgi:transcriptional regulator with XRE-family HTH domain